MLRTLAMGALAVGVAAGLPACGHLGIDFGDSGREDGGLAGSASWTAGGSTQADSGGSASSGGETSSGGNDGGSGGGPEGSGGESSGGADGAGGSEPGSGGVEASGGTGSGGAGGSGGTTSDCPTSDPLCAEIALILAHRYSFDGTGTQIVDTVDGEVGTLVGTTLDGSGEIALSGLNQYVTLPAGLISSLPNASFEVWFVWNGGEAWQRLFEFGDGATASNPYNYLYVTPQGGGSIVAENALAAGLRHPTGGDRQLRTTAITQTGVLTHVVLIADDTNNRLTLYKNGEWLAQRDTDVRLGDLVDAKNHLGRSLFDDDPDFNGVITEFRIYAEVLSAAAIEKSYTLGPDATFGP